VPYLEKVLETQGGSFYLSHVLPGRISFLIKDETEQVHGYRNLELAPNEARILAYALLMAAEREKWKKPRIHHPNHEVNSKEEINAFLMQMLE
jgi:hypothetical protein